MLRIGDRYRIPSNGVVIEIAKSDTGIWYEVQCVEFPEPRLNNHYWDIGQSAFIQETELEEWGCERLPNKSENFNSLYHKLNADLL